MSDMMAETPAAAEIDRINGQPRQGRDRRSVSAEPPNKRGRQERSESTPSSKDGSPPPRRRNVVAANTKIQENNLSATTLEKTSRDGSAVGPIGVDAQDIQIVEANTGNNGLTGSAGQGAGQGIQQAPISGAVVAADSVAKDVPALPNAPVERAISIITLSDDGDAKAAEPPKIAVPERPKGIVLDTITLSDDEDDVSRVLGSGRATAAAKKVVNPVEVLMEDIGSTRGRLALRNNAPTAPVESYEELKNPEEQGLSRYKIQMVEQRGVMAKYAAGNIYHYQYDDFHRNIIRLPPFPTPETWMPLFRSSWKLIENSIDGRVRKLFFVFCCNQKYFYEFLKTPYETENLDALDADQAHLYWEATPLSKKDHESRFTYYRYTSILALYKFYEHIWDAKDYSIVGGYMRDRYERDHMSAMEQYWKDEPSRKTQSFKEGYIYLRDLMERTDDCTYLEEMPRALLRLPTSFKEFIKGSELYESIKYTFKRINLMSGPVFEQLDSIRNDTYTLPSGQCLQKLLLNIGECILYHQNEWTIAPDVAKKVFDGIPFGPRGAPIPVFVRLVRQADQDQ